MFYCFIHALKVRFVDHVQAEGLLQKLALHLRLGRDRLRRVAMRRPPRVRPSVASTAVFSVQSVLLLMLLAIMKNIT